MWNTEWKCKAQQEWTGEVLEWFLVSWKLMRPTLVWGKQFWRQQPWNLSYSTVPRVAEFPQSCAVLAPALGQQQHQQQQQLRDGSSQVCFLPAGLWCWKIQLKLSLSTFLSLKHTLQCLCFVHSSGTVRRAYELGFSPQTLLPRTHSGYKKVGWSQSEPIMPE